ncbi:MAG: hypothetical protein WC760_00650 [Bacteroidia bacterium]
MPKIYTPNLVIRHLYHETTQGENSLLKAECLVHADLQDEVFAMEKVVNDLDEISLNPNPTSVRIILEYAQSLHEPAH